MKIALITRAKRHCAKMLNCAQANTVPAPKRDTKAPRHSVKFIANLSRRRRAPASLRNRPALQPHELLIRRAAAESGVLRPPAYRSETCLTRIKRAPMALQLPHLY